MPKYKACTKCKLTKPVTSFYRGKPGKNHGLRHRCIDCTKQDRAEYCRRNDAKRKSYARTYQPRATARMAERYRTDTRFRLARLLRARIHDALKVGGYSKKYQARQGSSLLGCSYDEYRSYLDGLFTEGMSWELLMSGEIHIDHIVPCSYFDLSDPRAQAACFHFSNTRPLWKSDNLVKSKRVYEDDISLVEQVRPFINRGRIIIQQNAQA
jgi:hypothetical protein